MKMKRKMGRRSIALFLVLMLCMNSLTAFASEPDTDRVQTEETEVSEETAQTEEEKVSEPVEKEIEPVKEQEKAQEEKPASEEKAAQENVSAPEKKEVKEETAVSGKEAEAAKKETANSSQKEKSDSQQETAEKAPKKAARAEVPKLVQTFLDAVQKLVDAGEPTEDNAEEYNALGQAAMEAYEAVQDAGLEDYEGVEEALMVLMGLADKITGGAQTTAGQWITEKVEVRIWNGKTFVEPTSSHQPVSSLRTRSYANGINVGNGYFDWTKKSNSKFEARAYASASSSNKWGIYLPSPGELYQNIKYDSYKYARSYPSSYISASAISTSPYRPTDAPTGNTIYLLIKEAAPTTYTYTLKYDGNGAAGNVPSNQSYGPTADTSWIPTLSTTVPERPGYIFKGWATSASNSTPDVRAYDESNRSWGATNTSKVTLTSSSPIKTIYAVWEERPNPVKVTLTYVDRGQTWKTETYNSGDTVTVSDCTNKNDGYQFLGWDSDPSADEVVYQATDTFRINDDTKLYAVWRKIEPRELTFKKTFEGLTEIPKDFSIVWNVTCGESLTASKTLTYSNADAIDNDTVTWKVPYFYDQDANNDVTIIENCDVEGYTYTASSAFGSVNGNTISMVINKMFSGGTRTITNEYVKNPEYASPSDLTITKSAEPGPYNAGEEVTYTITVKNQSSHTAQGVVISDTLNENLEFVSASLKVGDNASENVASVGQTISRSVDIPAKTSAVLTITAKVKENCTLTSITNTASMTYGGEEKDSSVDITVTPKPTTTTLSVTKEASRQEAKAGEEITYTITVKNEGAEAAEDVTVTDVLDGNLEFVSAFLGGDEISPVEGVYQIGALAGNAEVVLIITARVKEDAAAGTVISNTASADHSNKPEDGETPSDSVDVTVVEDEDPVPNRTITVNYVTDDEVPILLQSKTIGTSYKDGDTYDCNDWIDASFDGNGHHYILVKDSVNDPGNGTVNGDIIITAVYTVDDIGPDNGPDNIPDKYQATVTYEAVNGTIISGPEKVVVTLRGEDGEPSESGKAVLEAGQIPLTGPNEGFTGGTWSPSVPTVGVTEITGDITFVITYIPTSVDPVDPPVDPVDPPVDPVDPPVDPVDPPVDPVDPPVDPVDPPVDPVDPPVDPVDPPVDPVDPPVVPVDPVNPVRPVPENPTPENQTPTDTTPTDTTPTDTNPGAGPVVPAVPAVPAAFTPAPTTPAAPAAPVVPAEDEEVPLAANPDTNEDTLTEAEDEAVPLAAGPHDHKCCILHFLIMALALLVEVLYTKSMKKHQKKIFDTRRELADLEIRNRSAA